MLEQRHWAALLVGAALVLSCTHWVPTTGEFGPLPSQATISLHPALGCFMLNRGPWSPSDPGSAALYIDIPPAVRLGPGRVAVVKGAFGGFRLEPEVRTWYGQQVRSYWEPHGGSDSLELFWRIGDAGTYARLHVITPDSLSGFVAGFYDFAGYTDYRAPLHATRVKCVNLIPYTSA